MIRWLAVVLIGIITSFFLFPFNLPIQVVVNTKMILAAFGLGLFFIDKSFHREFNISKDFLILCIICSLISVWAFLTTTINRTSDYTFAKYIISVWVWLGGAYTVIWLIRAVHGELSVKLIGNYLVAVCAAQCLLAYGMTLMPGLKAFIDSLMGGSENYMGVAEGRIYGLGAALDPAGLRFAGALVILAHLIYHTDFSEKGWLGAFYLVSFAVITVFGNMIARTTTLGVVIAFVYILLLPLLGEKMPRPGAFWAVFAPLLLLFIVVSIELYNANYQFREDIRFGFEGFFSLVEKGRWEVHSNRLLRDMVVWPESLKTWMIGDGFFDTPEDVTNRFGQAMSGFYKQTDIGYLRYIFYFGIIGLIGMMAAVIQMTISCCKFLKEHRWMFIMLLLVTLIGWLKVSSDIIMVFAPFLILAYLSSGEE